MMHLQAWTAPGRRRAFVIPGQSNVPWHSCRIISKSKVKTRVRQMAVQRRRKIWQLSLPEDVIQGIRALAEQECRPPSREVEVALRRHLTASQKVQA
jgi:hypothetical protein